MYTKEKLIPEMLEELLNVSTGVFNTEDFTKKEIDKYLWDLWASEKEVDMNTEEKKECSAFFAEFVEACITLGIFVPTISQDKQKPYFKLDKEFLESRKEEHIYNILTILFVPKKEAQISFDMAKELKEHQVKISVENFTDEELINALRNRGYYGTLNKKFKI